jgi:hypothetical protein
MIGGQLVAAGPMAVGLGAARREPMTLHLSRPRVAWPAVPPRLVSRAMGAGVGAAYGFALGHPIIWVGFGLLASVFISRAAGHDR